MPDEHIGRLNSPSLQFRAQLPYDRLRIAHAAGHITAWITGATVRDSARAVIRDQRLDGVPDVERVTEACGKNHGSGPMARNSHLHVRDVGGIECTKCKAGKGDRQRLQPVQRLVKIAPGSMRPQHVSIPRKTPIGLPDDQIILLTKSTSVSCIHISYTISATRTASHLLRAKNDTSHISSR